MNARNATVLIVGGDAGVRKYFRKLLATEGYAVIEAADGDFAACAAKTRQVDLAVIDAASPGADALALGARIRGLRPEARLVYTSVYMGGGARLKGEFFLGREMAPLAFLEDITSLLAHGPRAPAPAD